MHNLLKGIIVSILLLLGLGIFLYLIGLKEIGELGALTILIPAFPIIGLVLGYAGTKIKTKRFRKLLLIGILLVYCAAIMLSFVLITTDDSNMIKTSEMASSIFFLSTVGFIIYGIAILPFLTLGVFFLERWTRPKEESSSS
ncbi:MAG: hypothetical protein IPO06_15385 [Leptospiraceae bacterium]|nr:hypothetical protein [Leptospiraceae bacterium]MBK9500726.1 hypothetical protein [Leptospiraceae bacterium]